MALRLVLVAAAVAVALTGCAEETTAPPADSGRGTAEELGGTWTLTTGWTGGGRIKPIPGYPVTLEIDGNQASGRSACNSYGTTLELEGDRIRFGPVAGTEMACRDDVMDLERRYSAALAAVDRALRHGDRLILTGGEVRLEFAQEPPVANKDLVGTPWLLEAMSRDPVATGRSRVPEWARRGHGCCSDETGPSWRGRDAARSRGGMSSKGRQLCLRESTPVRRRTAGERLPPRMPTSWPWSVMRSGPGWTDGS